MPRMSRSRGRRSRRPSARAFRFAPKPVTEQQGPPRGVKLKTVSRITLLFALVCLGAFLAGRPPVAADGHFGFAVKGTKGPRIARERLRNDNARLVLLGLHRQGKTLAKEIKKCAGPRAPVGLLLDQAQQEYEHVKDVGIF